MKVGQRGEGIKGEVSQRQIAAESGNLRLTTSIRTYCDSDGLLDCWLLLLNETYCSGIESKD